MIPDDIARLTFAKGVEPEEFRLTVDAAFEIRPVNPFNFLLMIVAASCLSSIPTAWQQELAPFLNHAKVSPRLKAFAPAGASSRATRPTSWRR